jgi:hypothetical protein
VRRLTEWWLERSLRRSTRAADRFAPYDLGESALRRDAERVDAGRPPGCGRMAAGLAAIPLAMALAVVAVAWGLSLVTGH